MPKIFIANLSNVDYSTVEELGETITMTTGYVDLMDQKKLFQRLEKHFKASDEEDYLLISGSSAICVVIAHMWCLYHGQARLLVFDKRYGGGGYKEILITNHMVQWEQKEQPSS